MNIKVMADIYHEGKNIPVNTVEIKVNDKEYTPFYVIRKISELQNSEDVLKLGTTCMVSANLGIKMMCKDQSGYTSFVSDTPKAVYYASSTGLTSCHIGSVNSNISERGTDEYFEPIYNGIRIGVNLYRKGYVINTGKETEGIMSLYGKTEAFIKSIGTRNVKSTGRQDAKTFETLKELKAYIEKNKDVFIFLVENYNYHLTVEKASKLWVSEKKESEDIISGLNNMISEINYRDPKPAIYPEPETGVATKEEMIEEAKRRMEVLGLLKDAVDSAVNERIMVSEGRGMLYYLNDEEKKYLNEIPKDRFVYHGIRSFVKDGNSTLKFFDVLSVSNNKEEWNYERPDGVENIVPSLCFSSMTYGDYEIGSIWVVPINGGLYRKFG